jgi:hypothetical protein
MSPTRADIYVNRRPCGCRHLAVAADVPKGLETMQGRLTAGWSLQVLAAEDADRLPAACDVCTPVRQETLL